MFAQRVIEESQEIHKEANDTHDKSEKLLKQYQHVKMELESKLSKVENSKDRAHDLINRAYNLTKKIKDAETSIDNLKNTPEAFLRSLEDNIQQLIQEMNQHNEKIAYKESYYKKCT